MTLVLLALLLGWCVGASAADPVRVGKAVSGSWVFVAPDVGMQAGIFQRYGLQVSAVSFAGDAKLQQGLASDSIDFGLGSGPAMAFTAKGSPAIAVAAFAGPPNDISIDVAADSPLKSAADLKGKMLAITTAGSLTEWLVKRVSISEGWGPNGIKSAAIGDLPTQTAALLSHEVDGVMGSTEIGYQLEADHRGRVLAGMGSFLPHFVTHVVFARKALVQQNPDLVRRFLKGFFATLAYEKTHEDETIKVAMPITNHSAAVLKKTQDYEIKMMIYDGEWDPQGLALIKQSFVDLHMLDKIPPDSAILTRQFVPVTP